MPYTLTKADIEKLVAHVGVSELVNRAERWEFDDRTPKALAEKLLLATYTRSADAPIDPRCSTFNLLLAEGNGTEFMRVEGGTVKSPAFVGCKINPNPSQAVSFTDTTISGIFAVSGKFDRCKIDGTQNAADSRMILYDVLAKNSTIIKSWIGTPSHLHQNSLGSFKQWWFKDCKLDGCSFFGEPLAHSPDDRARHAIISHQQAQKLVFSGVCQFTGINGAWVETVHEYNPAQNAVLAFEQMNGGQKQVMAFFGDQRINQYFDPNAVVDVNSLGRFISMFGNFQ